MNEQPAHRTVRYQSIVEDSLQGTVVVTQEGIVFANQTTAELTGYTVQELEALSLEDLWGVIHPDDRETMIKRREQRLSGRPVPDRYEFRFLHKTDGERLLEVKPTVVQTSQGPIVQAYVVDRSDRWRVEQARTELERQLCHAHKMEAVGTLAGGIAHDLNNVLQTIIGGVSLVRHEVPFGSSGVERLDVIESAAFHASTLVTQLLQFARMDAGETIPVNVSQLLDEITSMLEGSFQGRVALIKHVLVDQPVVQGNPAQLRQVFMNLAINACHAMPDGGKLQFTIWDQKPEKELPGEAQSEHCLVVAVSDTGTGISKNIQHRIFEPFFTTKEATEGTGLGLAIVFRIVENHKGSIYVESVPGSGTTFRICLPCGQTSSDSFAP